MANSIPYDIVIAGAGIVGLAHAYEAARRGLSVAVVEKDSRCVGASIRNFGFITISGQAQGDTWRRARYSRDIWNSIAPDAGIEVVHRGSWIACQRPEAIEVARAFLQSEMGVGCKLYQKPDFPQLLAEHPDANSLLLEDILGVLHSPLELRVESRTAIEKLAHWLEERWNVQFFWNTEVLGIRKPGVQTSSGPICADRVLLCCGGSLSGIAKTALADYDLKLCTLQMLRVRPAPGFRLPGSVMTDNSLARYSGWAELPEAEKLKACIKSEMPEYLEAGIHLIAVQSADGSLIVGDSHVYSDSETVFSSAEVDHLILNLARSVLDIGQAEIVERWVGTYPVWQGGDALIHRLSPRECIAVVTSGTGASTAFGLARDTFDIWR